MPTTVVDKFAETLAAAGVKRIHGIVSGSLNGPGHAIRPQGTITRLYVQHAEPATVAEVHVASELAVCAVLDIAKTNLQQ